MRFRDRRAQPPHLDHFAPDARMMAHTVIIKHFTHMRGRTLCFEKLTRFIAKKLLVFGKIEIHSGIVSQNRPVGQILQASNIAKLTCTETHNVTSKAKKAPIGSNLINCSNQTQSQI